MSVRVVRWVLAAMVGLLAARAAADMPETAIYETPLTNLVTAIDEIYVDPESGDGLVRFAISPIATPGEGRLILGLEPMGPDAPALIIVVNNSRAVRIPSSQEAVSAEIELPGHVLRRGTNIVTLALEDDETTGWRLDGAHSRLRVSYTMDRELASLGDVEAALAADVPQAGAIFIEDRPNDVMVEAVAAQGIALRMGRVPELVTDPASASIRVTYELDAELSGAEVRFSDNGTPGVILAGRHQQDLESAARLFASRSLRQADTVFTVVDALHAAAIGRENTRVESSQATLREFTEARLPFGDGRGAETAVILTEGDGDRRLAGLSIMARTAIAHETAWIYAWYGSNSHAAPENRHVVFVGTGALADRQLLDGAPVEFRTALRQAADHSGGSGLRLSSAAYASEGVPPSGVATVFTDPDNPTRWIAGFTSPEPAGFNRASEILSRSAHWGALTGRAAIWDEDGVTGYDYSLEGTPTLAQRYGLPDLSLREIALILFVLTMLFILRGIWRRRRVNDKSRGWR
ncbi:hypothetical protein V0U79_11755 [Hyphobacterium sp. HN65]|uniref:Cyclic di-GMP-binding protein n=1 Tax=Hyphobacterium lacteum TaxID=3116575 RepID=A0ABU7LT17_9PROT|nr:hypothetical protein [Hyphobacterium sp. HN65]MEE2527044.1 hypothetical protein [Hyphobacterium sp. HN65]